MGRLWAASWGGSAGRPEDRRIKVLEMYGLIDGAAKGRFETIRQRRRGYLHLWSRDHDSLPDDAVKSYYAAVALVATTIGQDFSDGKIVMARPGPGGISRRGSGSRPHGRVRAGLSGPGPFRLRDRLSAL